MAVHVSARTSPIEPTRTARSILSVSTVSALSPHSCVRHQPEISPKGSHRIAPRAQAFLSR